MSVARVKNMSKNKKSFKFCIGIKFDIVNFLKKTINNMKIKINCDGSEEYLKEWGIKNYL